MEMIDQALADGIRVSAWTFDELYGRDGKFLDAREQRRQVFVAEIPVDFHGWVRKPKILQEGPENTGFGRPKGYPRLAAGYHSSEVRNLAKHSARVSQAVVAAVPDPGHRQGPASVGSEVGRVLAEKRRRFTDAATLPGRGSTRVDWGGEILLVQPRAGSVESGHGRMHHAALAAASCLRSLFDRELLPRGQRRTGNGPLRSPRLAVGTSRSAVAPAATSVVVSTD